MGLFIQFHKCSAWALSGLPPKFVPLVKFCCPPLGGIRIFGVFFGFAFFTSFFLQKALGEDV
jgi:hypothetical protein